MSVIPAACLIGWPAAHSRSPLIHKYWLQAFGIDLPDSLYDPAQRYETK